MLTSGIKQAAMAAKNTFIPYYGRSGHLPTLLAALLLISTRHPAEAKDVRWDNLNLTTQQSLELDRLESDWRRVYAEVSPQIQKDTDELMHLLKSPNIDPQKLLQVQNRINDNKQRLQSEAMKIHLKKREKLNPEQRVQLQKMISD